MPLVASFCHCPTLSLLRLQRLDIIPYKEIKDTRAQLKIQAAILHQDFSLMLVSSFVQTAIVAILAKNVQRKKRCGVRPNHAKQTQFPKNPNERKLTYNKGLQK